MNTKEILQQIEVIEHELDLLKSMVKAGPPIERPDAATRGGGRTDPPPDEDPGQP